MRELSPAFADHIASGATTVCWCWRVTRRDGTRLGFTDHDADLEFDGTRFEAAAGMTASEMSQSVGLGVDNLEVLAALSSGRLEEADLSAGLFDDARVEIFRVNWQDVAQRVLMRSGSLGEVRRSGVTFAAEVRGLSHYLQQPKGRLYQFTCDADLGDGRCKVDLTASGLRATGSVVAAWSAHRLTVAGLGALEAGWMTHGLLTFTSGAASGQAIEVREHAVVNGDVVLDLWQAARLPLVAGQTFTVTAGCDKQHATCRTRFANALNFRGFPHMPGNDFVTSYVRRT